MTRRPIAPGHPFVKLALGALLWATCSAGTARAQSIIVTASTTEPGERELALVRALEAHLAEDPNGGWRRIGGTERRVTAMGSWDAPRHQAAFERLLEEVAFGRDQQAIAALQPELAAIEQHRARVGDDPSLRRHATDFAMLLARAQNNQHDSAAVERTLERLLRIDPSPEPDPNVHPPEVIALLRRMQLRHPSGALVVSTPSSSERCRLRVNGITVGDTPARLPLWPGDYAVQVRCGDASTSPRWVTIDSSAREIRLDPTLEQRLDELEGAARLRYPSGAELERRVRGDTERLAEIEGVRVAYLIADGTLAHVERYGDEWAWRMHGALRGSALEAVAEALRNEEAYDDEPGFEGGDGGGGYTGDAEGGPWFAIGLTIGAVGLAGVGVAWGLGVEWQARADYARTAVFGDADFQLRQDRRDELLAPVLAAGIAGSVLLGVGATFAIDESLDAWWPWVLGGVGFAAIVVGAVVWSTENQCADDRCMDLQKGGVPFGPLIVANGASLLWVPFGAMVHHALRGDGSSSAAAATSPTASLVPWASADRLGASLVGAW
ncbi:MAG: hypothetical protein AB7P00_24945 [Sandaracinaceae bacterium]